MNDVYMESAKKGFVVFRNNKRTKWKLSIESMVPIKKRNKIEHYYILIKNNNKVVDRVFFNDNGSIEFVYDGKDVANYIKDMVVYILDNGDVNRYIINNNINNKFTELGKARRKA